MSGRTEHVDAFLDAARRHAEAVRDFDEVLQAVLNAGASTTVLGAAIGLPEGTVRRWARDGFPGWRLSE